MSEYNGWKNYETWNVALWIGNDEFLYSEAKRARSYGPFVKAMRSYQDPEVNNLCFETPDGVKWSDSEIDTDAIDEMIGEL